MKYFTSVGDVTREFRFERRGETLVAHCGAEKELVVDAASVGDGTATSLLVDGVSHDLVLEQEGGNTIVQVCGRRIVVRVLDQRERAALEVAGNKPGGAQEVEAAMPGVVIDVLVAPGDVVEDGQTLVILEAMKMQNPLRADGGGVVQRVLVKPGDTVAAGALLAEIDGGEG